MKPVPISRKNIQRSPCAGSQRDIVSQEHRNQVVYPMYQRQLPRAAGGWKPRPVRSRRCARHAWRDDGPRGGRRPQWGLDKQPGGSAPSERGAAERREELRLGESTVVPGPGSGSNTALNLLPMMHTLHPEGKLRGRELNPGLPRDRRKY